MKAISYIAASLYCLACIIFAAASKYDLVSFVADGTAWSGSIMQNYSV